MRFLNNALSVFALTLMPMMVMAQGEGKMIDKIIAKVDNHIILHSDIEGAYANAKASNQLPPDGKCGVFKSILTQKILYARAEIDSIIVEDIMVEGELSRRISYFEAQYGGKETMEKFLNKTVSELRDEMRPLIKEQMTIQKVQQDITSSIEVTPLEVKRYFNSIPKDSIPFLPAEVEVSQIVLKPKIGKTQKEAAKNLLIEIKKAVEGGEDFCSYTSISEDPGSANNCGDLGWHGRGELVPEFEAVALNLNPGELSDPVESEFGFHLIKLEKRLGNKFLAKHILKRPEKTKQDFEAAGHFLDSLRKLILADSISFEKAAMTHSDDKATRPYGGSATSQLTGETKVPTNELNTGLFFAIQNMKVGTISEPQRFRMADGQEAMRIIYFKSETPPHDASLETDYQKLAMAAANNKKNDAINKWVQEAISVVYLDIAPEYDECAGEVVNEQ